MKRLLLLITMLFTMSILIACGDDSDTNEANTAETEDSTEEIEAADSDDEAEENQATEEDEENDTESEESSSSNSGIFQVTVEDQLDLQVGDTGTVQTSIGTFELTVDSAELVGTELDGVETVLEGLIVLDLTFKNIDEQVIIAEDIMSMLGITDDLDGSNNHNNPEAFESIDVFEGELEPGEERQTQFVAHIYDAEEYYFRVDSGNVAAGTSNQVIWTIPAEEAR